MAFVPGHINACWEEDWDDFYEYEDCWDDLYDSEEYWDEIWDDDDIYDEVWLDDIVVTPEEDSDDWNEDDDWWRTEEDDEWNEDECDDIEFEDDDDYNVGFSETSSSEENDVDKTPYLKQNCQLCCVPAVLAIMNMYANKLSVAEAEKLQEKYKQIFKEKTNTDVSVVGVRSDQIAAFMRDCGFEINKCTVESISLCTDKGYQVFVFIDIVTSEGTYGHALDVIRSDRDAEGKVVSYVCINPDTGKEENHVASDFSHPLNIYCVKNIK